MNKAKTHDNNAQMDEDGLPSYAIDHSGSKPRKRAKQEELFHQKDDLDIYIENVTE